MSGYMPHAVQDDDDTAFGDVMAGKLSAVHCSRAEEQHALTARLHVLADRMAGATYAAATEQEIEERVALLTDLIGKLEDVVPG